MKKVDQVFAWLLVVLGLLHCSGTFAFYKPLSLNAVWFFGTGVAMITLGFCNIARVRHSGDALLRVFAVVANALTLLYCAGFLWFLGSRVKSAPQALIVTVFVVIEFLFSVAGK